MVTVMGAAVFLKVALKGPVEMTKEWRRLRTGRCDLFAVLLKRRLFDL
jgi:hypothetical protein